MRKYLMTTLAIFFVGAVSACGEEKTLEYPLADHYTEMNEMSLRLHFVVAQEAAIIRQHTIYPYHFVPHSAELNGLGMREVDVLARHRVRYPGPVNLRHGDESEELYETRIQTLFDRFASAGLPRESIRIADGLPGGEGASSEEVVIIRSRMTGRSGSSSGGNQSMSPNAGTGTQGGGY